MGEDPSRRIWFGIDGGAIRYDGFRWQKLGIESGIESSARSFAQAGGVFFAATRSAIYRFEHDAFQQVSPPLDDRRHWVIEDLTSSADGGLWAATNWGAVHLQGLRYTPGQADWKRITLLSTAEIVKQFQVEVDAEAIETVIVAETESRRWQSGAGICVLSSDPERNVVIAVAEDGPAARAGIRIGDRVTSINGEQRISVFQRELQGAPGRTLQISAERAGETELIRASIVFDPLDGSYRVFRPFRVAQHAAGTVWFASRLGHIYSASGGTGDQFRWTYHTRQHNLEPVGMPSIAVTSKGLVAVGRNTSNRAMLKYDGKSWSSIELPRGIGSSILALNNGKILVGTNGAVLSVGPGGRVVDHAMQDYGIFGNEVILEMASDNALWILGVGSFALRVEPQDRWTSFNGLDYQDSGSDSAGFDRFDGESWARAPLPSMLAFGVDYSGMREGRDGDIWLNSVGLGHVNRDLAQSAGADLSGAVSKIRTYRFARDSVAPETRIDARPTESMYGNEVVVGWSGSDRFNRTEQNDLVFSWRIGDQPWRPFSSKGQVSLQDLGVGKHRVQVRARDADFNVDATPAESTVVILPVSWQRSWFHSLLLLTGALMILGVVQTFRVFRSEASLQVSNQKLIAAEHELRSANSSLEKRVLLRTKELNDANQRLYESEVKYRSIVDDQSEYIVRFDTDKNPTFMNEAFRRSLGAANGNTTLEDPNNLLERLEQVASNLAPSSSTHHIIVRHELIEGKTRWEQWHCRALRDAAGNLLGYQAIGADITELREAEDRLNEKEQQLAHLARVSALGEMVAGISHEINQPLASISNFSAASLMMLDRESEDIEKTEKRENVREWIGRINEQANRINEIIKSLRRFGRPSTNRESFDIAQAVDEAMALCEAKIRAVVADVELHIPPSLPKVYADRIQIEQVLVNLVRNACDAMVSTEITDRNLHIEGTTENEFVKIVVTDSGPGIPPEQIEEVFRAFTTTKSDGMGIGLAISRSIVESHGGTLHAIDFDGGCRFEFTLPTTAPQ